MKSKNILQIVVVILLTNLSHGQKVNTATADKNYNNYAYIDAIATYEKLAAKGYKDQEMFQKLGNAYYFNADLNNAAKWYEALFDLSDDQQVEYYYRYSQCLKSCNDYEKADKMLVLFNSKSGSDLRAKLFKKNQDYLAIIKSNSGRFIIEDSGINSIYSDYGASVYENKLIFASARDTGGTSKKVFRWTNQSFTNLYSSEINADGGLANPKQLNSTINSKFHESTPVFTKDGKTMYFTRNNYIDGKIGKDADRITLLKLYKATLKDDKWTNVIELPFNSDNYSVAHPALSTDEKTLYFASDMPGTLGQSDLFKVTINEEGTFSSPINLGSSINTEGRETFPFISENNDLYFASDGRPGLGGLDIYVTSIHANGDLSEIQNIGAPVNSSSDDFSFYLNCKTKTGFFTSNRAGGNGYDDIYKFKEIREIEFKHILSGIITDAESKDVLVAAKVTLYDANYLIVKEIKTDSYGMYSFEVNCGKNYYVRAEKDTYQTNEGKVIIPTTSGESNLSVALSKNIKTVGIGSDLAKALDIPMIYFDLDKSNIRKDAAFQLEKVLIVMIDNPAMKIDIRSHTDSRQTEKYNNALSDRRSKSTMTWLISNGITTDRLTAKGYGESQLVNKCSDGIKCSEKEHQENRRSEFIIVSLD